MMCQSSVPFLAGHVEVVKDEWIAGTNAGGSRNCLINFATNPQFVMTLYEPGMYDKVVTNLKVEVQCMV